MIWAFRESKRINHIHYHTSAYVLTFHGIIENFPVRFNDDTNNEMKQCNNVTDVVVAWNRTILAHPIWMKFSERFNIKPTFYFNLMFALQSSISNSLWHCLLHTLSILLAGSAIMHQLNLNRRTTLIYTCRTFVTGRFNLILTLFGAVCFRPILNTLYTWLLGHDGGRLTIGNLGHRKYLLAQKPFLV